MEGLNKPRNNCRYAYSRITEEFRIRASSKIYIGLAMAQWLVAGLLQRRPGFAPGSICVGFLVDTVEVGRGFIRVRRFPPVSIIPPWLSISIYHLGGEQ
jgi:hypothetical protein